jgi:hypothetical protein
VRRILAKLRSRPLRLVVVATLLAGAAGTAWASTEQAGESHHRTGPAPASAAQRAAASRAAGQRSAAEVVARLARAGLPVADPRRCTEPSPTSPTLPPAVAFRDTRLTDSYPVPTVFAGGDVEVFDSPAALRERRAALRQQALDAHSFGFDEGGHLLQPERDYAIGSTLLRLSGDLGAPEAAAYRRAFRTAVGAAGSTLDHSTDLQEVPCSI